LAAENHSNNDNQLSTPALNLKCYNHTWVKEDEAIAPNEIKATAPGLGAEQEHKLVVSGVAELLHQLLPLADARAAIQPQARVLRTNEKKYISFESALQSE
jgi:hypothetical protein